MIPKSDPFSGQSARSLRYAPMARRPIRAIARKARWSRPGLHRYFGAVQLLGLDQDDQISLPFEGYPPGEAT